MPLFFSYATCGAEEPAAGCDCVGIDNKAGSIRFTLDGYALRYPAETGGGCEAWDEKNHPLCAVKGRGLKAVAALRLRSEAQLLLSEVVLCGPLQLGAA